VKCGFSFLLARTRKASMGSIAALFRLWPVGGARGWCMWQAEQGEDHRRFYGLDFAERLVRAGFCVVTFRVSPEDEVRYGLLRDEWLMIAEKLVPQVAERDRVGCAAPCSLD
jgi:hypothetical protein